MKNRPNHELKLAEDFIRETDCNIFVTGKAGTGKTTFLHTLKKNCDKRMIVTAPTGVAAINGGGVTLHSFFQLPFGPFVPTIQEGNRHRFSKEKINIIKSLDLLVIDEISMVRADLLDSVDSVLRRYRRSEAAFGGVQLLLVGDLHQLPPVVKDDDWQLLKNYYGSPYFFSSNALGQTKLLTINLRHNYRQQDSRFIELLNRVRSGSVDGATLAALNSRYSAGFVDHHNEGYITLCSHNINADTINESRLKEFASKSHRFTAVVEGDFPAHAYPAPLELEVKENAQVMFLRNDPSPEKRFFNGKIGEITRIADDRIWIRCPGDKEEIEVEPATWENIQYTFDPGDLEISQNKVGAFTQYPLKLAWAITIHKSQGLTFDRVIVDAQAAFAHGQVYVALSRCRTMSGVILTSPLTAKAIKTDRAVRGFIRDGEINMPTAAQLESAKVRYQQRLLLECFDFQTLQLLVNRLVYLVEKHGRLIQVSGAGDLRGQLKKNIDELTSVAANFRQQLRGLLKRTKPPEQDETVTERVVKASAYFQEKIETGIVNMLEHLILESDNSKIRKNLAALLHQLREETTVMLASVKSCRNGFNVAQYLRAKSSAALMTPVTKQKSAPPVYSEADIAHPELFQRLKEWRRNRASAEQVALYQVMHQKTLVQIAVNLPDSLANLLKINGVGKKTAEKYGAELVEIVAAYRQQNHLQEVVPPTPHRPETEETSKKSSRKDSAVPTRLLSLELFLEKLSLEEIAQKRNLTLSTIEGHLANCIEKGEITVDRLLSPAALDVIQQKLKKLPHERLREIKEALNDEYSYGQIKFALAHKNLSGESDT